LESYLKPGWRGDISFWVAFTFTLGSAFWVVNGFIVWFPIFLPDLATTAYQNGAAATAFLGGTTFEIGAYLMVVESLDRGREIQFGTALGDLLVHRRNMRASHDPADVKDVYDQVSQRKPQSNRHNDESDSARTRLGEVEAIVREKTEDLGRVIHTGSGQRGLRGAEGWVWWGKPMWHDMGYTASFIQLCAASIFWVATLTGLPGVIPGFYQGSANVAILDVFYWTPQVIGGTGFIIASLIFMLEVQTKWYKPNLTDIGWHIGLWNLIGAVGFTLCGALGYSTASGEVYQSALATFWGSWAFIIGSIIQVFESVWREEAPKDLKSNNVGKEIHANNKRLQEDGKAMA